MFEVFHQNKSCHNPNSTSTQLKSWVWHPPNHHRNSMSAISQLLLTQFWWHFKGRLLWTFGTDSNCHSDIFVQATLCNICPYQEYLSCYWPNFDETLKVGSWEHLDSNCHSDLCLGNICPGDICPYQEYLSCYWPNILAVSDLILTKP